MTSGPANVSFFADPAALAPLKSEAKANSPAALKEVEKQFESLFTQMLLKSMREANKSLSNGDSLFGSDQADFYQDMFDQQMAVHLSQGSGLGLADVLVRQLAGIGGSGEPRAVSKTEAASGAGAGLRAQMAMLVRRGGAAVGYRKNSAMAGCLGG